MRVKINVGGQIFETYSETLACSSYFSALLERWGGQEIFIDRDPRAFSAILNWLRGCQDMPEKYLSELEFYGIDYQKETFDNEYFLDHFENDNPVYVKMLENFLVKESAWQSADLYKTIRKPIATIVSVVEMTDNKFIIPQYKIDIINSIRLLANKNVKIKNAKLFAGDIIIGEYDNLFTDNGECELPFLKEGFLLPFLTPYTNISISIDWDSPPEKAILLLQGDVILQSYQEKFTNTTFVETTITSRKTIKCVGNKCEYFPNYRKTGEININAFHGEERIPVEYIKLYSDNKSLIMIKPENFSLTFLCQLQNPEIEIVSRYPVDAFELSIEEHSPMQIKDGIMKKIYF